MKEKQELQKQDHIFLKTGASTREIAKYFTENRFKISNYTVSQYIKEYMNMFPLTRESIEEK